MTGVERYAVMGDPVAHSRSPSIHTAFAAQTGELIQYDRLRVAPEALAAAVEGFFAEGGRGLNITVPHKAAAAALCQRLTPRAALAGAVNTLWREGSDLVGDTTDGAGLLWDLQRLQAPLAGARILLLGAGGAVRGVLEPLLQARPASVTIANRTAARARELAQIFQPLGHLAAVGFDQLPARPFDLIINGTSASLSGELPPLPETSVTAPCLVYDMMYGAEPTPLMRWASERGARVADGLGMLVGQAGESYRIWRGLAPDCDTVLSVLRTRL